MANALGARLMALADRIDRLKPLNHDPEAYFIDRDAIRTELIAEARALDRAAVAPNPRGRFDAGLVSVNGRVVRAEGRGERAKPKRGAR